MPFKMLPSGALVAELGEGDIQISSSRDKLGRAWVSLHFSGVRGEPGADLPHDVAGERAFAIVASKPSDLDVVERTIATARALLEAPTHREDNGAPVTGRGGDDDGR